MNELSGYLTPVYILMTGTYTKQKSKYHIGNYGKDINGFNNKLYPINPIHIWF